MQRALGGREAFVVSRGGLVWKGVCGRRGGRSGAGGSGRLAEVCARRSYGRQALAEEAIATDAYGHCRYG